MSSMNKYDPAIQIGGAKLALAYDALKANLHKLPGKDLKFAKDMLAAYEKSPVHGTHKQQYWLIKMAETASGVAENDPNFGLVELTPTGSVKTQAVPEEKPKIGIPGFESVYALFATAQTKLKYPKINLKLPDGSTLLLYLSGQNSTKPGVINLTNGKPYGQNKWYGRIHPDGTWEQPKNYVPAMTVLSDKFKMGPSDQFKMSTSVVEVDQIEFVLKALANDPHKVASAYGELTGNCCFCKKPLSDPHSTAVGFGYVCALHYGLGDKWKNAAGILEQQSPSNIGMNLGQLLTTKIEAEQGAWAVPVGVSETAAAQKALTATTVNLDEAMTERTKPVKKKRDYLF